MRVARVGVTLVGDLASGDPRDRVTGVTFWKHAWLEGADQMVSLLVYAGREHRRRNRVR